MKLLVQSASQIERQTLTQLTAVLNTSSSVNMDGHQIEFSLPVAPNNETRASIRHICKQHQCDYGWIDNPRAFESYSLLVFDMDSTLINIECIDELADCVGRKAEVATITERAMRGEDMDYDSSLIARVQLLKGLAKDELKRIYDERVQVTPGAHRLVQEAQRSGLKTAIISGGFDDFANRLQVELNIDVAIANRLVTEDGILTGTIENQPINAERKASTVKSLCASWEIAPTDVIIVGDGANDLKMMEISGLSVGYRPKEVVARVADIVIDHLSLDSLLCYL